MGRLIKWLLVLLILASAAAPALIGVFARQQLSTALTEQWPDASQRWDAGWMRSKLQLSHEDFDAELSLNHISLSPAGWLSAQGRVIAEDPPLVVDTSGRIGWTGTFALQVDADTFARPGPPRWLYQSPDLAVTGAFGRTMALKLETPSLTISDSLGNLLELRDAKLEASLSRADNDRVDLDLNLNLTRPGQPPSVLKLVVNNMDRDALASLFDAMRTLSEFEPSSAAGRMAQLGVASAWQQLVAAGFSSTLESLKLDGDFELQGRWQNDQPAALSGGGQRATLLDWMATTTGLQVGLPPDIAREQADAWLDQGGAQGWLVQRGQRVELNLAAPAGP